MSQPSDALRSATTSQLDCLHPPPKFVYAVKTAVIGISAELLDWVFSPNLHFTQLLALLANNHHDRRHTSICESAAMTDTGELHPDCELQTESCAAMLVLEPEYLLRILARESKV